MRQYRCLSLILVLLLLIGVVAPMVADQKRVVTIDDIFAYKSPSDLQISPDGKRALFVLSQWDFKENLANTDIWIVSTTGGEPIQLTYGPKRDFHPRWSPKGNLIAFLSNRLYKGSAEVGSDEKGDKTQIYLINPNGGEAWRLTESKTSISSFEWSPDGKRIAYVAPDTLSAEEEKKRREKDDAIVVDEKFQMSHIWVIDVESKKVARRTGGNFHVDNVSWSPDAKWLVFSARPTPKVPDNFNTDVYVVSADSGDPRKIVDRPGPDSNPQFSPDGKSIAFISMDGRANDWIGNRNLCIVPANGGVITNISKSFDENVGSYWWSPDGKTIYFQSTLRTAGQLFALSVGGKQARQITGGPYSHSSFSFSGDFKKVIFLRQNVTTPPDVYVADLPAMNPTKLTTLNPQLKEIFFGEGEIVRWKSTDGMEMEGVLIKPVGFEKGKRYPLLVHVHGGPAGIHTVDFPIGGVYSSQLFAGAGYAVFKPNPRGSGGYGEKFRKANIRDWGEGDYNDIMTGVDHLIKEGIADENKLGIMGWSYGGFMTSRVITKTHRFKAASIGAAVTNGVSFAGQTDIPEFMAYYFGGWPWDDLKVYLDLSPIFHVKGVRTPSLIQHGEVDLRVPLAQGQEMYLALKKQGVPVEFVTYPREPHGLQEPKHVKDAVTRNLNWFNKWILGKEPKTVSKAAE